MAKQVSGDRLVVTGIERGSVFPSTREDCYRDLLIDGAEQPVLLEGGAFSLAVQVEGSGRVHGPLFSGTSLQMTNDGEKGPLCLLAGATARSTITAAPRGQVARSAADFLADTDDILFVIRGDVVAGRRISLQNACVIGTLRAPEVELLNSIAFGLIDASERIAISGGVFGMYRTTHLLLEGPVASYCVGGLSRERPELRLLEREGSPEQTSPLRLLPLCRRTGWGCGFEVDPSAPAEEAVTRGLYCSDWARGKCPHRDNVELLPLDFVEMDLQETKSRRETAWFLTIEGRAADMGPVYEASDRFESVLHGVCAFEHLTREDRVLQHDLWTKLSTDEARLFRMATRGLDERNEK
jgi:hypothetical protein